MTNEELVAFRYGVRLGTLEERERIIDLVERYRDAECGFGVTHDLVALIKGENE